MSRTAAVLVGVALALSLVACGSDRSRPPVEMAAGPTAATPEFTTPDASPEASVVPSCEPSPTVPSTGLTGVWEANDDGIYDVRETDDGRVWWFGTDVGRTRGKTFSNVAVGQIDGDVIQLEWADVPLGDHRGAGSLSLRVSPDRSTLTAIEPTGGFGGSAWTRLLDCGSP